MSKIHINSNGEPGVCKAKPGACPFGDESTHFSSSEEAATAYSKAHEAMGNASFGKSDLKPGEAFTYLETRDEAEKVANLITNEGKYAAIIEYSSKWAIGEPDESDYEDEDDYEEAMEEFRESIEDGEVEFEKPDSRGFQVRAFDSFEEAKSADPDFWNTNRDRTILPISIEDPDVFHSETDVDPYNNRVFELSVEFRKPKK